MRFVDAKVGEERHFQLLTKENRPRALRRGSSQAGLAGAPIQPGRETPTIAWTEGRPHHQANSDALARPALPVFRLRATVAVDQRNTDNSAMPQPENGCEGTGPLVGQSDSTRKFLKHAPKAISICNVHFQRMPANAECACRNIYVGFVERKIGYELLLVADAFSRRSNLCFCLSQIPFESGSIHARNLIAFWRSTRSPRTVGWPARTTSPASSLASHRR
jgi:hypothetical protein